MLREISGGILRLERDHNSQDTWRNYSLVPHEMKYAGTVEAGTEIAVRRFVTPYGAKDDQVYTELDRKIRFSYLEISWVVAAMLEQQKWGREGLLVAPDVWNVFHTAKEIIFVAHESCSNRLVVRAIPREANALWNQGNCEKVIFSRA